MLFGWVVSTKSRQTSFEAVIFVICNKEHVGHIWGWVLRMFCATIVITFVSEIFSSMPPLDICIKLNHVVSISMLPGWVGGIYFYFCFACTFHNSSQSQHTHTPQGGGGDHIKIHIGMKLVHFIMFLLKT